MAKKNSEPKKQVEPAVEAEKPVEAVEPAVEAEKPVEAVEPVAETEPVEPIEEAEHAEENNDNFISSILDEEAVCTKTELEEELEIEEEFESNRAKDILKKNLIANVHILHGGKQYKPGDILPCSDIEMVELWCLHKSAHWE